MDCVSQIQIGSMDQGSEACALVPQPAGLGAEALHTRGLNEHVIYGVSTLKCIPRDSIGNFTSVFSS